VDEQVQMRELVQRAFQAGGNEASGDLESRLNASKGGGSPLAPEVRAFMEPRFGADFSSVRVHTGSEAVQMNRELGAQAFAHGSDVYFGAGKSPGNDELTAHELTHVVQQTGGVQTQFLPNQLTVQQKCSNCEGDQVKLKESPEAVIGREAAPVDLAITSTSTSTIQRADGPCKDVPPRIPHHLIIRDSVHPDVREAQRKLNQYHRQEEAAGRPGLPDAPLVEDCIFGSKTYNATLAFQKRVFPTQPEEHDGKIGDHTWAELDKVSASPTPPTPTPPTPTPPTPTPPTPTPPTPTIASQTVNAAPNGAPNTRTEIGVGEQVRFTGSASGTWSMSGGTAVGVTSGTTFLWKAPEVGGSVTITLTNGSNTATTTMNVIAPTSLSMTKRSEDSIPAGTAGAGMLLNVTINPLNVCLGETQLLEVPGPATNITGYFTQFSATTLKHNPSPNYTPFGDNNTLCCDHAALNGLSSPFSNGTFQWDIPNKYKLDGEPDSSGRNFTTTTQLFTIDSAGTVTITKAGASVSRSP
jgi:hypothetical protein